MNVEFATETAYPLDYAIVSGIPLTYSESAQEAACKIQTKMGFAT